MHGRQEEDKPPRNSIALNICHFPRTLVARAQSLVVRLNRSFSPAASGESKAAPVEPTEQLEDVGLPPRRSAASHESNRSEAKSDSAAEESKSLGLSDILRAPLRYFPYQPTDYIPDPNANMTENLRRIWNSSAVAMLLNSLADSDDPVTDILQFLATTMGINAIAQHIFFPLMTRDDSTGQKHGDDELKANGEHKHSSDEFKMARNPQFGSVRTYSFFFIRFEIFTFSPIQVANRDVIDLSSVRRPLTMLQRVTAMITDVYSLDSFSAQWADAGLELNRTNIQLLSVPRRRDFVISIFTETRARAERGQQLEVQQAEEKVGEDSDKRSTILPLNNRF